MPIEKKIAAYNLQERQRAKGTVCIYFSECFHSIQNFPAPIWGQRGYATSTANSSGLWKGWSHGLIVDRPRVRCRLDNINSIPATV
jgi:hypothetical protein